MTRNRVQDQVDDGADVELVTIQDPRSSFYYLLLEKGAFVNLYIF